MKFWELKILFEEELDKVKAEKKPQTRYIILAYRRVTNEIDRTYTDQENVTEDRIRDLEITNHMKNKLLDLSKKKITEKHRKKYKQNKLRHDLEKILGVGPKKINELIADGLTDIKQLKSKKWLDKLNTDARLIVEHNPLRKIPHEDIKKIEKKITGFGKKTVIAGSFRRKRDFSRDIDILFLSTEKGDVSKYLKYLEKQFPGTIIYAHGENKISMILQPDKKNPDLKYKADIFVANTDNYYTALLYTTGSGQFNAAQRARAKRLGYLLNQNGIYDLRTKRKVNRPEDDEKKLFEILNMKYVIPEKRI